MPSCHDDLPPLDLSRPTAVSILAGEHRVILQVLDCLERMAAAPGLPADDARSAIEVIRTFADRCHHGKEEAILSQPWRASHPASARSR